jgi:prephenate dehydrogenase
MSQRILIIGLGLLGGSLGLALQASGEATVHGRDAEPAAQAQALALGLVQGLPEPAPYDVILLAMPPGAAGAVAAGLGPWCGPGTLLMDVCSVKGAVIRAVREALGPCPRFLPAHPMAGSHLDGPGAARADLFRGRKVLLTPLPETAPEALAEGRAFWEALGASTVDLEPAEHDRSLALLSHLPHLLAFNLAGEARRAGADRSLAGPAFEEATRLALCPPGLWADIFLENRDALLPRLRAYRQGLDALEATLVEGDRTTLEQRLEAAREWTRGDNRTQR